MGRDVVTTPTTPTGTRLVAAFDAYVAECETRGVEASGERLIGEQIRDIYLPLIEAEAAGQERERLRAKAAVYGGETHLLDVGWLLADPEPT